MHKNGQLGNQILIFSFMFMLIIIGGGIAAGNYLFFGSSYNFKDVDAQILNYKISRCISENKIDDNFWANFYDICSIEKGAVERAVTRIKICENSEDCISEANPKFSTGGDFQICGVNTAQKDEKFQQCAFNSVIKEGIKYNIVIGINQEVRRVAG